MQMEAQALKGLFHMLLLSVLLDGQLHPWAIQQVLQEHAETFTFGNDSVYTSLRRLEHKGLVSQHSGSGQRSDPPRLRDNPGGTEPTGRQLGGVGGVHRVVRGIVHHHQEGERQEPADPAQSRA
jgi:hypothetical protein